MNARERIEDLLHEFVARELLDGDAEGLTPATNLLRLGVIDSLSMVSLRRFIEQTFGVRLPNDLQPEDLSTVTAITTVIERLQRATGAGSQGS